MTIKILFAIDENREIFLKPFINELEKNQIKIKIINDLQIYNSFLNKKLLRWIKTPEKFKQILEEFNPDFVFTERVSHFCSLLIKEKIPYFIFLRGDFCLGAVMVGCASYRVSPRLTNNLPYFRLP